MSEYPAIRDYLYELARVLEAGPTERERILAEAEDHLVEAANQLRAVSTTWEDAERAAIERFGSAGEIATRYEDERKLRVGQSQKWRWFAAPAAAVSLLLAAAAILLTNHAAEEPPAGARGAAPKEREFTAVKLATVYNELGEVHSITARVEAFRADGSRFFMSPPQNDGVAQRPRSQDLRYVEDRTKRLSAMILPGERMVSSFSVPETESWGTRSYPEPKLCSYLLEALDSDPPSERAVMRGYEVRKHTFGADGSHEVWVAPELDCYEMSSTQWRLDVNRRKSRIAMVAEAVFIREGDPPAEYFDVPADFRECPPSELMQTAEKSLDLVTANTDDEARRRIYELADKRYLRFRVQRQ